MKIVCYLSRKEGCLLHTNGCIGMKFNHVLGGAHVLKPPISLEVYY